MPRNKDLKRLVRTRMKKTGEAYTTARARITSRPKSRKTSSPRSAAVALQDYAVLAGMSDAKLKEKTGRTWRDWVEVLDREQAADWPHGKIAELVNGKYEVDGWWSQMVTVGYERIKGLRARGQRRDGTYEANKSRTFNVAVGKLFDAWAVAKLRKRWLDEPGLKVRTATKPKSMRIGFSDGSIAAIGFEDKGKSKSIVSVQHTRLRDRESAERLKQYWSDRLNVLKATLAEA